MAGSSRACNFGGLRQRRRSGGTRRAATTSDGIDELVVLDVTATLEGRRALLETIRAVARELFIPLAVGGGIRTLEDAHAVIDAGADKVSINSAALADPGLITRPRASVYGSQAVVVAIDAKRAERHGLHSVAARRRSPGTPSRGRGKPQTAAPARSC